MKNTKVCLFIIFLIISYSNNAFSAKKVVKIYADDGYPPYSYEEKGKAIGIYPDILIKLNSYLKNYTIELEPIPYKRGLKMLETGDGFAIIPPYIRKERDYILPYSDELLKESVAVFCNDSVLKKKRVNFPEDYKGITFGVNAGFIIAPIIEENFKNKNFLKDESRDIDSAIQKLISGRIDCYVNDKMSIYHTVNKMKKDSKNYELIKDKIAKFKLNFVKVVSFETAHIGYAKKSDKFPFKNEFIEIANEGIKKMKQNGEIDKILNNYIKGIK